ncbi:MAG: DUF4442 domain-containing protein [Actinobacteria bacterium]|nr:DUF4442 domain-containing protein [Actinomycetota bacterium]
MSETLWDVERLTEATRQSVPMAAQTRVEVVEAERGRVVLRMPLEGNGNHIGTMYAGALFALCEFPGGTLFSTTFDASRYSLPGWRTPGHRPPRGPRSHAAAPRPQRDPRCTQGPGTRRGVRRGRRPGRTARGRTRRDGRTSSHRSGRRSCP